MQGVFPQQDWSPHRPDPGADLWRYMDFRQLVSIFEKRSLWFSSVANFFDPFEGALPESKVEELAENFPKAVTGSEEIVRYLYDSLKYTTFASCWHQREQETAAMWELYQDQGKEVAIRTSVEGLETALRSEDELTFGCVTYSEYENAEDFVVNRVSPFFHKRPSFEHEREFRAVLSDFEVPEGAAIDERYAEKMDAETPPGQPVSVDVEGLIHELVVSPVAPGWMQSLVEDVTETYGLSGVTVRESGLNNQPY